MKVRQKILYIVLGFVVGGIIALIIGNIVGSHVDAARRNLRDEIDRNVELELEALAFLEETARRFAANETEFQLPEGLQLEYINKTSWFGIYVENNPVPFWFVRSEWTGREFLQIYTIFEVRYRVIGDLPDYMGNILRNAIRATVIDDETVYVLTQLMFIEYIDGEWVLYQVMYL